ncbi:hypothetical protein [Legionella genomosp. 1]|uniref:hypothetical protein n=1 Tax=Legionella genomosp. 1 TaxID=1093625 RepID=UPI00105532CB|nr:hypothetical protein [Legionella genomosp. 1]
MSSTNLQLGASDVEKRLHHLFGSRSPSEFIKASDEIDFEFFSRENIKGYIYKPNGSGFDPKKYWVEENNNHIIITTAVSVHHSVAKKGTYVTNFKKEELDEILNHIKSLHPNKPVHMISPRVESGLREDHIVIEYTCHDKVSKTCIIDSKSSPSGRSHAEVSRIHTEKQAFLNSTDCGFHVVSTIPILGDIIRNNQPINQTSLRNHLQVADFEHSIAYEKLKKLHDIYSDRTASGDKKHSTLFFFRFGILPSVKKASVEKILENIDNGRDIFTGMSKPEIEAAKDSVLGETVKEYMRTAAASFQPNPFIHPR